MGTMDTTSTITAPTTDARELYARGADTARELIARVTPGDLRRPTPCDDMDVEALVSHLLMGVERVVALGSGANPMQLPDTSAEPEGGWVAGWDAVVARARAAWADDATLERPMWLPWAQGPGSLLLTSYTAELTAHTWDLARALGHEADWDSEVVAAAWASYRATFPDAERQARFAEVRAAMPPEMQVGPPPFGDGIELGPDAALVDRVAAWTGRDTAWTPATV